jgi:hypothetical protein
MFTGLRLPRQGAMCRGKGPARETCGCPRDVRMPETCGCPRDVRMPERCADARERRADARDVPRPTRRCSRDRETRLRPEARQRRGCLAWPRRSSPPDVTTRSSPLHLASISRIFVANHSRLRLRAKSRADELEPSNASGICHANAEDVFHQVGAQREDDVTDAIAESGFGSVIGIEPGFPGVDRLLQNFSIFRGEARMNRA